MNNIDICIGEGEIGDSWEKVKRKFDIIDILQNNHSYQIHNVFLGFGMYIIKNTYISAELEFMINSKNMNIIQFVASEADIIKFLQKLILSKIDIDILNKTINDKLETAFAEGKSTRVS